MLSNHNLPQPSIRQLQEYAAGAAEISAPDRQDNITLPPARKAEYLTRLVAEYSRRITDALELYKPLPTVERFHSCAVKKKLLRGSNRSGKTNGAGAEVARIVRGRDPHAEAKGLPTKNGRALCVGADASHIAQVMWKKISWPGAFWIIPDEHTGVLRAVRPHPEDPARLDDYDESYRPTFCGGTCKKSKWIPAAPFIPPDEIADVAYEKKNLDQVKRVVTTAGWEMLFHTSEGNLRKGIEVNLGWFDEDIKAPRWFGEMFARLVDRDGIWIWSFTPEESTPQAVLYHEMADENPENIAEFFLSIDDNPYLTSRAKQAFHDSLSEDERAIKYFGQYGATARKVYPSFDPKEVHRVEVCEIPPNWMRVAAHDPGTQRLGSLLCAVNPEATELHIYDEVFLTHSDSVGLCKKLEPKVKPFRWKDHIIDYRAGRQTPFGMVKRVKEHYEEQFEAHGLCENANFLWGCDDVPSREEAVRSLLRIDGRSGKPKLRVHVEKCPHFCKQMKAQYYKEDQPGKRETRSVSEMVDCMEYIAAYFSDGLFYEPPEIIEEEDPEKIVARLFAKKQKRKKLEGRRQGALAVWNDLAPVT